jgi:dUTPase
LHRLDQKAATAQSHGVTCLNNPGLIDAGYCDQMRVLLVNTDAETRLRGARGD